MLLGSQVAADSTVKVPIENNSCCLAAFVTVGEGTYNSRGELEGIKLIFAAWFEPGESSSVYMKEGEMYAVMVEAFKYDTVSHKIGQKAGESYKEGRYSSEAPGSKKIDIRCKHTLPRET